MTNWLPLSVASSSALIVMAKQPCPGRTKTRLTPPLTVQDSADLYACFLRDVIELASGLPDVTPFIAYTPLTAAPFFRQFAPGVQLIPQVGNTLGERLAFVLTRLLDAGFEHVAAMNSDSPNLPQRFLAEAFLLLGEPDTDVVLGPCDDGGYYLIGWNRPNPRLVRDVTMSTPHVLQDTLALAAADNLHVRLLPSWYDVDSAAELLRLRADLEQQSAAIHTRAFLRHLPSLQTP
ncbi:MAG: TIGR04282 family arsenosugar biosynthesis glycosyltransferase [Anaerolineae bacterium]|nr:TIGR04282 family arsenosugar biosynthesis glycosyltransferase [Anaerolineae bacterium]